MAPSWAHHIVRDRESNTANRSAGRLTLLHACLFYQCSNEGVPRCHSRNTLRGWAGQSGWC